MRRDCREWGVLAYWLQSFAWGDENFLICMVVCVPNNMSVFNAIELHFSNEVVNLMLCVFDHHKKEWIVSFAKIIFGMHKWDHLNFPLVPAHSELS